MTRQLTEEELHAWNLLVGNVRPSPPISSQAKIQTVIHEDSGQKSDKVREVPREIIATALQGMTRLDRKRLSQGKQLPDAVLDLHGYRRQEAHLAFEQFLQSAASQGHRLLCVITGYGRSMQNEGVLKKELPLWVNLAHNQRLIAEFGHAPLTLGGKGAWLIRLKSQSKA